MIDPATLEESYAVVCPKCDHAFSVIPSISMEHGINRGHTGCPECKSLLHVEIQDGEMVTELWDMYLTRIGAYRI